MVSSSYLIQCLVVVCMIQLCTCYTCVRYVDGDSYELTCSTDYCCGHGPNKYCCSDPGVIAGGVIGSIIFVCIVAAIICCLCSCCPVYQRRHRDIIITTGPQYSSTVPVRRTVTTVSQGPYTTVGGYTAPPPYQQM